MSFANKVVIVTGASSGIGATTAILFAKEGANVVMVGRNEIKLKNVAEQCANGGIKPLVVKADVSKDSDAKRIIEETFNAFGKIDVLVNNAGIGIKASVLEGDILKSYDETMNTNLRAVIHMTSLAAPYLIKTKGNIVNISSIAAKSSMPSFITYSVSKAGLNHFTKGAALELSTAGVRVNCIEPGPVRTNMIEASGNDMTWEMYESITPLRRISEPEEIADMIMYLASDKAKAITGSIFTSDNGISLKI